MKQRLAEESILFISVIKWVAPATGVGALIGVVATFFLKLLAWGTAGVEVLFVGTILYDVLLPYFIAGITAYQVSSALGIQYFYHPVQLLPQFTEVFFLKVILALVFSNQYLGLGLETR